jgi:hypothetical protein
MHTTHILGGALAVLTLAPLSIALQQESGGCPASKPKATLAANSDTKSIVATASAAGQFGTLLAAA